MVLDLTGRNSSHLHHRNSNNNPEQEECLPTAVILTKVQCRLLALVQIDRCRLIWVPRRPILDTHQVCLINPQISLTRILTRFIHVSCRWSQHESVRPATTTATKLGTGQYDAWRTARKPSPRHASPRRQRRSTTIWSADFRPASSRPVSYTTPLYEAALAASFAATATAENVRHGFIAGPSSSCAISRPAAAFSSAIATTANATAAAHGALSSTWHEQCHHHDWCVI